MSYQVISDFRAGLDFRKFKLSQPPGSLIELINGHVTPGAEIEKRKAFGLIALPSKVYGAQETLTGIVVFGSRAVQWTGGIYIYGAAGGGTVDFTLDTASAGANALPEVGDSITISGASQPAMNGTFTVIAAVGGTYTVAIGTDVGFHTESFSVVLNFPTPAIYQPLAYPDPIYADDIQLVSVISSTYFDGKTFAVTLWDDGSILCFYGADPVLDFYIGDGYTVEFYPQKMAEDLAAQIESSGLYTVTVQPVASLYFTITSGTVSAGVNKVTQVTYNFNRTVKLPNGSEGTSFWFLVGAVDYNTDNATTAADVATGMAGLAAAYGFTVTRSSNKLTIVPPATDFYGNPLGVQGTDTLTVAVAGDVTTFIPEVAATFDVLSIPNDYNVPQFSVTAVVQDASLKYKLVSNGVQPIAPSGAIGQIQISAGTANYSATGKIAYTAALPADGSTITVGSMTYTFRNVITGTANEVKIDTTPTKTLTNLVAAINNTSGAGTAYSASTLINPDCSANAVAGGFTTLTASLGGTVGNALALAQSGAVFTLTAFAGGGDKAKGSVTSSGVNVSDGDTVTIGAKTYRFKTAMAAINDVKIGASADASLTNLLLAVNATGTAGTNYFAGTTANATVAATDQDTTNHIIYLRAIASGTAGNSIALAKSAATLTLSAATLAGGGVDINFIGPITVAGTDLLQGVTIPFTKDLNTLTNDLVTAINSNQGVTDFSAESQNNVISLIALNPGTTYNAAEVVVTASGSVCIANCFLTVGATAGQNISVITGNLDAVNLLTSTLTFQDSGHTTETAAGFCARTAANINNKPGGKYRACAIANQLFLSATVVSSSDVAENINVTHTATVVTGATTDITVTFGTSRYIPWVKKNAYVSKNTVYWFESFGQPNSVVLLVKGGVAPFTYSWRKVSGSNCTPQISDNYKNAGVTTKNYQWWKTPSVSSATNSYAQSEWVCDIADAVGNTVTSESVFIG